MIGLQKAMAYGFVGIVFAFVGSTLGGLAGWAISDFGDPSLDEYLLHIPWAFNKAFGTTVGVLVGAVVGFPSGIFVNALWMSRIDRRLPGSDVETDENVTT